MKEVEFIARVSGGGLVLTDSQQAAKYAPINAARQIPADKPPPMQYAGPCLSFRK